MCGIAGYLNRDGRPAALDVVQAMTDAIAHRGPDGQGQLALGCCGLGHRRLAIIDLSTGGAQPMSTPDGRYHISFNGEIYNYQELKGVLESRSWTFRSSSDTEVLLYGFAEWGADVVGRLDGMFAFVIWDSVRAELFAARDRFGVKPLYYSTSGSVLLFASEIKALLAHPEFRAEVDLEGLREYLAFQNFVTDRTLWRGVRLLPPGSTMSARRGELSRPNVSQYWDFQFREPEFPRTAAEYTEELESLLEGAIRRQLVSDVDIGTYLSGGMDSGTIATVAGRSVPLLRSFTAGFDLRTAAAAEARFDERGRAECMSHRIGTEHYETVLKASDMERSMSRVAWHLEEPRVGQSYPNYYAARLAAAFVKVVLAGTGGDELFGGYPWRYLPAVGSRNSDDFVQRCLGFWRRLMPPGELPKLCRPFWNSVEHVTDEDLFRGVFSRRPIQVERPSDYLHHCMYFEAKTFLQGLLVVEDKLSMAHGLETRVPFLDNSLADFAMRLPAALKVSGLDANSGSCAASARIPGDRSVQATADGKTLLRKVMGKLLPSEIANAAKQGFSAPDASWFRGESRAYVEMHLRDPGARIYEWLDRETVCGLLDEHLDGRANRRLLIWSLLNLEHWQAHYGVMCAPSRASLRSTG